MQTGLIWITIKADYSIDWINISTKFTFVNCIKFHFVISIKLSADDTCNNSKFLTPYISLLKKAYLSCMTRMNWWTWFSSTSSPSSFLIISAASYLFIRLSTFVIVPLLTPSDGPLKIFFYFLKFKKVFWIFKILKIFKNLKIFTDFKSKWD